MQAWYSFKEHGEHADSTRHKQARKQAFSTDWIGQLSKMCVCSCSPNPKERVNFEVSYFDLSTWFWFWFWTDRHIRPFALCLKCLFLRSKRPWRKCVTKANYRNSFLQLVVTVKRNVGAPLSGCNDEAHYPASQDGNIIHHTTLFRIFLFLWILICVAPILRNICLGTVCDFKHFVYFIWIQIIGCDWKQRHHASNKACCGEFTVLPATIGIQAVWTRVKI